MKGQAEEGGKKNESGPVSIAKLFSLLSEEDQKKIEAAKGSRKRAVKLDEAVLNRRITL